MTTHKEFDFDDKVSDDIDELVIDLLWRCQGYIIEQRASPTTDPKKIEDLAQKMYSENGTAIEKILYEASAPHPFSSVVSIALMRQSLMMATLHCFKMEKALANMFSENELEQ